MAERKSTPAREADGLMSADLRISADELVDAILAASHDAVVICDADGRIATWNELSARLFGYSAAKAVGRPLAVLFADHVRSEVLAVVGRVLAGERIVGFESESVREDGLPVPVSLAMSPVGAPGQAARALVAIVRDVTEQRLAQATLAEVEVRLREGEAMAHVGSWLWDVRTDVVQWSVEFHRLHGVDPLEFGGTLESYLSVIDPADRDQLKEAMEGAVATGRSFEMEYGVPTRGRVFLRAQPAVGLAGSVVGLRGVGRSVQS
jgi:PAS domain S-box-containing protein